MYRYRLFGGILLSDVELPELERSGPGEPRWILESHSGPPPRPDGIQLGEDSVTGEVRVRMCRQENGLRVRFDDTGSFDISSDGARIRWYRPEAAKLADVRADLTGRILAAALHAAGTLSLHASAVVLGENAIGLIGPKGHGKSTLSLALVAAGGALLTDDTFPVQVGDQAMGLPGLHAARLWPDSASRVGLGEISSADPGEKFIFSRLPADRISHEPAPLAALYLLSPMAAAEGEAAVRRTALPPIQCALAMLGHAKLAPLLRTEADQLLSAAIGLTEKVPVYRLDVMRDLDRLSEVASTLWSWHSSPVGQASQT